MKVFPIEEHLDIRLHKLLPQNKEMP